MVRVRVSVRIRVTFSFSNGWHRLSQRALSRILRRRPYMRAQLLGLALRPYWTAQSTSVCTLDLARSDYYADFSLLLTL